MLHSVAHATLSLRCIKVSREKSCNEQHPGVISSKRSSPSEWTISKLNLVRALVVLAPVEVRGDSRRPGRGLALLVAHSCLSSANYVVRL